MSARLTGLDVLVLEWDFVAHLKMASGAYRVCYRCTRFPTLTITKGREPRQPLEQRMFLGEEELVWGDWDAVAARLNALPRSEAA